MSQDCEICGKDQNEDHSTCRQTEAINYLGEQVEVLAKQMKVLCNILKERQGGLP